MISVIIRAKNEERWIGSCLDAVVGQTIKNIEIVLVDNCSTDRTVDKALAYGVKLVSIDNYIPGKAINTGIAVAKGDIIVCLSGHCIPASDTWLEELVAALKDPQVAGVYGRQEPLSFTDDADKRDLLITFGLDRREQIKDSFFHNANSAFRKSLWEKYPFDETVAHIEDRIWAHTVQQEGFKIVYEPLASVFHHHGIHHTGSEKRCSNTVKILESIGPEELKTADNNIDIAGQKIVAVIPVRLDGTQLLSGKPLFEHAIEAAKDSRLCTSIVVSTDDDLVAIQARKLGTDVELRAPAPKHFDPILEHIMRDCLAAMESRGEFPDLLVMLEPGFPFRTRGLLDQLIRKHVEGGFDTVFPAKVELNSCWQAQNNGYQRIDKGHIAQQYKDPLFVGIKGLGCVSSAMVIREGELFGQQIGIYQLDDELCHLEVKSTEQLRIAEALIGLRF